MCHKELVTNNPPGLNAVLFIQFVEVFLQICRGRRHFLALTSTRSQQLSSSEDVLEEKLQTKERGGQQEQIISEMGAVALKKFENLITEGRAKIYLSTFMSTVLQSCNVLSVQGIKDNT